MYSKVWDGMLWVVSSGEVDKVEAREEEGTGNTSLGEKWFYQWVISRLEEKLLDLR